MKEGYVNSGRTNQKLETRSKILESANHFLSKGLNFNLEDVAERTGISRATIYRYFSSVEILAAESALDISTKSPQVLYDSLKEQPLKEKILNVQDYFNSLAIDHERAFRKYLSTTLNSHSSEMIRGARRKKTLELILQDTDLEATEKEKLANLLTIIMGIEPLIVTKDVCGLNSTESKELMQFGMKLLLKSVFDDKK